jgi:Acetyltransferase (GNAT) domain
MIQVRPFAPTDRRQWTEFLDHSKTGLFIFHRDYMEYHADRFEDHSLVFVQDDEPVALLPAHLANGALHSHAGLTFGGFVTDYWMKAETMLEVVDALIDYCRARHISPIIYKPVPHPYHVIPALFQRGAKLIRRDAAFVVDQQARGLYQDAKQQRARSANRRLRNRLRNLRKAKESGVVVEQSSNSEELRTFVSILEEVLMTGHGARPTHTYEELQLLFDRFPEQMKLYLARKGRGGDILAGAIVYESNRNVARAQYSANSPEGRRLRALDLVFDEIISLIYSDRRYFDFGGAVEDGGRRLNEGLAEYKESQGGRLVTYDFYELPV